jgi:dTMP kinase
MKRGLFVVIEALDGVGKTTLVRDLAVALGGLALDTPGEQIRPIRSAVLDALGDDQVARCLFYAATVIAQGRRARELADRGATVVMDRYWGSTISYARARGVAVDLSTIGGSAAAPDATVLVTLDETERVGRLIGRGDMTPADVETLDSAFRATVLRHLREVANVEVDITGADRKEAVARVCRALPL